MRLTVLGGCGAWPEASSACSGYLVEHDGFHLLLDAGYATLPRLLQHVPAERVDAVFVTHGHPDHCADLNPLLRARALRDSPPPPLALYSPPDALTAVLALDRPGLLAAAHELRPFAPGDDLTIGPFRVRTALLPHWLPNAAVRLTAGGMTLVYTGDGGPSPLLPRLADGADVLLAEATYVAEVPQDSRLFLSSAVQAGRTATAAGVGRLLLTHLWPGTPPGAAVEAAAGSFTGPIAVAAAP